MNTTKTILWLSMLFLSIITGLNAQSSNKKLNDIKTELTNAKNLIHLKNKYYNEEYETLVTIYIDSENKKQETYLQAISKTKKIKTHDVIVCEKSAINPKTEFLKIIEIDSATRIKARHIFLKDHDDKRINMIFEKLKSGEKFESLALLYNEDGSRDSGGELGYLYSGQVLKEFEKAVISHPVGRAFIVKTAYGYHIVESLEIPKKVLSYQVFRLIFDPNYKQTENKM